jgi:hypothetical protein
MDLSKYSLDHDLLDKEYEISSIEEFHLRNIRKKVDENIQHISNILSSILQPETDMANLHEASFFDENEKNEIIEIFKKLKYIERASTNLDLEDSDEKNAEFIRNAQEQLDELKPKLIIILKKLQDCWKQDIKSEEAGYFG